MSMTPTSKNMNSDAPISANTSAVSKLRSCALTNKDKTWAAIRASDRHLSCDEIRAYLKLLFSVDC